MRKEENGRTIYRKTKKSKRFSVSDIFICVMAVIVILMCVNAFFKG